MTGTGSALADTLNDVFGLRLADSAEARAWLTDGGWDRLDAWLAGHASDHAEEDTAA